MMIYSFFIFLISNNKQFNSKCNHFDNTDTFGIRKTGGTQVQ